MSLTYTYPNVTADEWIRIKAVLAQNGVIVTTDKGTVDSHEISVAYQFAGNALLVSVLDAPFYLGGVHTVGGLLDGKIKEQLG